MKHRILTILTLLALLLMSVVPLAAQDAASPFPITVEHKFGSTTITELPEHIISLGFSDQDALFVLGIQPVAVRHWFGDAPHRIFPWAEAEANGAEPIVLEFENSINYEALLELEPDLIVAVYSGITEDEYELLSQVAPTLPQTADYIDYGMPWDKTTQHIGQALGLTTEADALVAETEALFAEAREQNPVFEGKEIVVVGNWGEGYFTYTAQDPRVRFFTNLGFVFPADLAEMAGDQYWLSISEERVDLLDRDLVVVIGLQFAEDGSAAARERIASDPLLSQLDVVKEGRVYFVPDVYDDALNFATILSNAYLLDNLVPEIAAVLEPTDATASASPCADGFHLFENENIVEPVCVPETAKRIVTLDPFYSLQMSLEMNLPIIASATYSSDGGFPEALSAEALAGLEAVGGFEAPNLETITALEPDLIIGDAYFQAEQYELLNEIAPTVLISTADWQTWYSIIAAAAGVPERAEAAFDAYNARIADLQAVMPDNVTVSFLRVVPDGFQLYRETPNAYAPVAVMHDAGVIRPEFERGTDEQSFARLDYEGLTHIEGEILLYVVGGADDDGEQLEAETLSNPIWQALPAVQAGQSYRVDASHWMSFGGLGSAHAVLDDLFKYVADVDPQEVSPNPLLTDKEISD